MLPDISKLTPAKQLIYIRTLNDYKRVSEALKDVNCKDRDLLALHQARLCSELDTLHLTPEDKVRMYLDGRADELPPDGAGKDEICGKLLPTQEEVDIGMYPERALYYYSPFTCGIYMFYTEDGRFKYIGSSQYIEYALHASFCRYRAKKEGKSERKSPVRDMRPVRYMLDKYPGQVKFKILEKVPYSLLDTALRYQRAKHKCMWQYDLRCKTKWNAEDFEAGKYNY